MFEKKDGKDPLSIYENNGASGNAFTNEFVTAYHFTGVGHFYQNLEQAYSDSFVACAPLTSYEHTCIRIVSPKNNRYM